MYIYAHRATLEILVLLRFLISLSAAQVRYLLSRKHPRRAPDSSPSSSTHIPDRKLIPLVALYDDGWLCHPVAPAIAAAGARKNLLTV